MTSSSTYLNWFSRLLILGAVVAGLTASAAGARVDPGDAGLGSTSSGFVSHTTPPGLKADGLRLPGIARVSEQPQGAGIGPTWEHQLHSPGTVSQYPTHAGLQADLLRRHGIAQVYKQQQQQSVRASGGSSFDPNDYAIGIGRGLESFPTIKPLGVEQERAP